MELYASGLIWRSDGSRLPHPSLEVFSYKVVPL
jgi:hypothetical protein